MTQTFLLLISYLQIAPVISHTDSLPVLCSKLQNNHLKKKQSPCQYAGVIFFKSAIRDHMNFSRENRQLVLLNRYYNQRFFFI